MTAYLRLSVAIVTGFDLVVRIGIGNAPPPVVTSISIDQGDTAGGTPVTVTGTGFTGATACTFGGVALTSLVVVNSTTLTGITGAHAKGTVSVIVTTPLGTGTLVSAFEYWNPSAIAALVLWLRADLGVTLNGGNVSSWADQSGLGDSNRNAVQATADDQPPLNATDATYNNRATIGTFNRAMPSDACRLVQGGINWSATYGTYTMGVVGHADAVSNRYFTFGSAGNYSALLNSTDTPRLYGGNGGNTIAAGAGLSTPKCFVMGEWNDLSSKIFVNATATATATGTLDSDSLGAAPLNIGSYPGSSSAFGVEKMAELFAFNGLLGAGDRIKLRKYINDRYAKAMTN